MQAAQDSAARAEGRGLDHARHSPPPVDYGKPIELSGHDGERGFSLIELALAITVGAFLMMGVLTIMQAQEQKRRIEKKEQITVDVHKTLKDFMTRPRPDAYPELVDNGATVPPPGYRFPCPADPALPSSNAGFGLEMIDPATSADPDADDNPSDSTLACDPALETAPGSGVFVGVLPTTTIGISGDRAFDINGNLLTYAVSGTMARWGSVLDKTLIGAITIVDEDDNIVRTDAPYVIVSHGDDQRGAMTKNAVNALGEVCRATTDGDAENCNDDAVFRVASATIAETDDFYDDQVSYRLEEILNAEDIHWNLDPNGDDIYNTNSGDVRLESSSLFIDDDAAPFIEFQESGTPVGGLAYDGAAMVLETDAGNTVVSAGGANNVTLRANGADTVSVSDTAVTVTGDASVSGNATLGDNIADTATVTGSLSVGGDASVAGNAVITGDVGVGDLGRACGGGGAPYGAIRYNAGADQIEYCANSDSWEPVTPNPGACGAAAGTPSAAAPAAGLCSSGTASAVSDGGSQWTWSCSGTACTAPKPSNGQCGSAHGTTRAAAPSGAELCDYGTASAVTSNPSTWDWTCAGDAGGTTASCQADKTTPDENGVCGPATGVATASAPNGASSLCDAGTPNNNPATLNTGTDPDRWEWTCMGSGSGGNSPLCTAPKSTGDASVALCNEQGLFYAPAHPKADLATGCTSPFALMEVQTVTVERCLRNDSINVVRATCPEGYTLLDCVGGGGDVDEAEEGVKITRIDDPDRPYCYMQVKRPRCLSTIPGTEQTVTAFCVKSDYGPKAGKCGPRAGTVHSPLTSGTKTPAKPSWCAEDANNSTVVSGGAGGPWTWTCEGGGAKPDANCSATYIDCTTVANMCMMMCFMSPDPFGCQASCMAGQGCL